MTEIDKMASRFLNFETSEPEMVSSGVKLGPWKFPSLYGDIYGNGI